MSIDITIICENCTESTGLIGENGFSTFIETKDRTYLLDTGPGFSLSHNAHALKKDLSKIDIIFLSHGHRDHTGGLEWVVAHSRPVEVVAHSNIFDPHSVKKSDTGLFHKIDCPVSARELQAQGASLRMVDRTTEIEPGIHFITGVDRCEDQIPADLRLVLPGASINTYVQDPVWDDASLLITTSRAPILLLGCAHSGLLNILDHIEKKMGVTQLAAVIGGTHLKYTGTEMVAKVIDRLESFRVERVAACHCTGFSASAILLKHFGKRFSKAYAGSVYRFS